MKICSFLFLFIFSTSGLFSQSSFRQFRKLSAPEKRWVIAHPCIAKKAMITTREVLSVVDSIKRTGIIGNDMNGGKLDAFKHAYWMASLSLSIGNKKALRLGKAHEKSNYKEFKKHRLEDSILPDSVSSVMDLRNNEAGAGSVGRCHFKITPKEVQTLILELLNGGNLFVIRKDKQGNYLYCDGTFIDTNEWGGKWNIPKCLIASGKD